MKKLSLLPTELIETRILLIRGQKVMLDRDLSDLFGVETKYLNRQVKRNIERFPSEFMFQLNENEKNELVTNWHRFKSLKHSTRLPYAFTEYGIVMLSSVLRSKTATQINIQIIRVFVKLRQILSLHKDILHKIQEHDQQIKYIFEYLRKQLSSSKPSKRKIGFVFEKGKV